MAYSKEFKAVTIKLLLPPNNKPLSHLNEQTNIPIETLAKWHEELRKNGHAAPSGEEQTKWLNSRNKFLIVAETISMKKFQVPLSARLSVPLKVQDTHQS